MKNVMYERAVLERKIKEGSVISADLQTAIEIAKASTAEKDRVNFAKVKQILNSRDAE